MVGTGQFVRSASDGENVKAPPGAGGWAGGRAGHVLASIDGRKWGPILQTLQK